MSQGTLNLYKLRSPRRALKGVRHTHFPFPKMFFKSAIEFIDRYYKEANFTVDHTIVGMESFVHSFHFCPSSEIDSLYIVREPHVSSPDCLISLQKNGRQDSEGWIHTAHFTVETVETSDKGRIITKGVSNESDVVGSSECRWMGPLVVNCSHAKALFTLAAQPLD